MNVATDLGIVGGAVIIAAVVVLLLTRRTHLRSWRVGFFYESEDRFPKDPNKDREP